MAKGAFMAKGGMCGMHTPEIWPVNAQAVHILLVMHSCYIFILAMPFLPPADEVVGR